MEIRVAQKRRQARMVRKIRIRRIISGTAERPRLVVFRSARHISVQVIDDTVGHTLVSATSQSKEMLSAGQNLTKVEVAKKVGELIATRCKEKGIESVVFDRGGFLYHGRISALADAAREAGLKF